MKADRNQLVMQGLTSDPFKNIKSVGGIPLRLHVAAMFMAPFCGEVSRSKIEVAAKDCLMMADALIKAHNDTCGG